MDISEAFQNVSNFWFSFFLLKSSKNERRHAGLTLRYLSCAVTLLSPCFSNLPRLSSCCMILCISVFDKCVLCPISTVQMLALHRYNTQEKKGQSVYVFHLNLFQSIRGEIVIIWIGNKISHIIQLLVEEKAGNLTEMTSAW